MAVDVRLYLFVLSPLRGCDVAICRNPQDAVTSWRAAVAAEPTASAFVHVGCVRPRVDEIGRALVAFPGRVFLSEAARWALPSTYACEGWIAFTLPYPDGAGELHAYLAASGWGYAIRPSERPKPVARNDVPIGWLSEGMARAPDVVSRLLGAGITNDAAYTQWREHADPLVRRDADRVRFEILLEGLGKVERDDPSLLIPILPFDLLKRPVASLDPPARLDSFCTSHLIYAIDELRTWTRADLMAVKNLARGSVRALSEILVSAAREDGRGGPGVGPAPIASLAGRLAHGLQRVDERTGRILRARLAYGEPFQILEDIGASLNVTRERVRQLEHAGLAKLASVAFGDDALRVELRQHVVGAASPVYLDLLVAGEPWFAGLSEANVERVIEAFSDDEFHVVHEGARSVVTGTSQEVWDGVKKETLAYLAQNLGQSREDVDLHIQSAARAARAPELGTLLQAYLRPLLHFGQRSGDRREVLSGVGWEGRNAAATVLLEAESPLHISEIAKRISAVRGEDVARGVVARWLTELEARLFDRGTYGLESHIPSTIRSSDVLEFVDDLVRGEARDRQWHVWEIFEALTGERPDLCDGLTPYILNMLMRRLPATDYEYHGRFVWSFKGRGLDEAERIDIGDAFVAALLAAQRPLTTEELHRAVAEARGLHPGGFMFRAGRLIRVAPGTWGLIDRDTPMAPSEQRAVMDTLVQALQRSGRELHMSEVLGVARESGARIPPDVSGYLLCSLAQTDDRFRWSRGQLLGLREWGSPKRPTVSRAFQDVAALIVQPTSLETIWQQVCERVERVIPKMQVSAQLQGSALWFDEVEEMWCPERRKEAPADEEVDAVVDSVRVSHGGVRES